jgi:hypothetical protein
MRISLLYRGGKECGEARGYFLKALVCIGVCEPKLFFGHGVKNVMKQEAVF